MSKATDGSNMLSGADLRDIDRRILEYLTEGRVTPHYCWRRMKQEEFGKFGNGGEYSRGYVHERLSELAKHDHAHNLLGTGLYELRDDPRQSE